MSERAPAASAESFIWIHLLNNPAKCLIACASYESRWSKDHYFNRKCCEKTVCQRNELLTQILRRKVDCLWLEVKCVIWLVSVKVITKIMKFSLVFFLFLKTDILVPNSHRRWSQYWLGWLNKSDVLKCCVHSFFQGNRPTMCDLISGGGVVFKHLKNYVTFKMYFINTGSSFVD